MKKLKDINWNQIYYFYEVAQSGSMSKGAQVIGVSVSTVSQQIGHLERFVNSPLFVRGRAHLRLTKEGETLFQLTREMFETGHRLLDTISPNAIGGYSVRVGIQESLTIAIGFPFVSRYWDLYAPYGVVNTFGVQSTENAVEKLLSGQLDWAILFQPGLSSKLESREIATTTVHFCCSSFINDRYEDKKSIFKALPLALSSADAHVNDLIYKHLNKELVQSEEVIFTAHREFAFNLCRRGRCIVPLGDHSVKTLLSNDSVATFSIGSPLEVRIYAVWPKSNEKMVSIKKLKELCAGKTPDTYNDPNFQLKLLDTKS